MKNYLISEREEDFQQAIKMAQKIIEIEPDYALLYTNLAWIYQHRYELTGNESYQEQVLEYCRKAYQLDPNLAESNAGIAWVYFVEDEYEKAYQHFKKALEINPNIPQINHVIGLYYKYIGLYHQAISFFSRTYEMDPYYLYTILNLALCLRYTGDFIKSADFFQKYFEIKPYSSEYYCYYADLLIMMKDYKQAEELLNEVMEKEPDYRRLPYYQALLYAARGKKEKALRRYQNPSSPIYALLGMNDQAIELMMKEIEQGQEYSYHSLMNTPYYDSLRENPCFQKIVKKQNKIHEKRLKKFSLIKNTQI